MKTLVFTFQIFAMIWKYPTMYGWVLRKMVQIWAGEFRITWGRIKLIVFRLRYGV